jgi:hypothetical protein
MLHCIDGEQILQVIVSRVADFALRSYSGRVCNIGDAMLALNIYCLQVAFLSIQ